MAAHNDVADSDGWATVAGIKCSSDFPPRIRAKLTGAVVPLVLAAWSR